ncbi:hypothetical protein ABQE97_22175, partial [Xanthomonas campestris pv. campestris]|uniref:hypothetical protein n=1 Tax=Xanthomonas campestris TaxID=339 RepID=UPI002B395F32|nr:hypothetical protein [Xanthomonas campestris pv. campestris]
LAREGLDRERPIARKRAPTGTEPSRGAYAALVVARDKINAYACQALAMAPPSKASNAQLL